MTHPFTRGMAKATALTRSGKLLDATVAIQSLLNPSATPVRTPDGTPTGTVIDGEYTRLDPSTPLPSPPTAKPTQTDTKPKARRASLSETLRKIAAGGMPLPGPLSGSTAPLPKGAQFLTLTHSAAEGSRSYRLYIPAGLATAARPLIVMLHGCTQTPEDFAIGTGMNALAEEFGYLVAYPAQPSNANLQNCWNWYRQEDQTRDQGEPAVLAGMVRAIWHDHNADPLRTYVAGLSAGGAAAVVLAAAYPDIFSAVGVHSGLPLGAARDIPSAFAAMRGGAKGKPLPTAVPTIVFHGLDDSTVNPDNGDAVLEQALYNSPDLKRESRPGAANGGRRFQVTTHNLADGRSFAEHWQIAGAGHAWAGGQAAGSFTDPKGPDASREALRFFQQHRKGRA